MDDKPFAGDLWNAICMAGSSVIGTTEGHPKFPDGTTIQTSKIVSLFEAGEYYVVETANSIYHVHFDPEYVAWYKESLKGSMAERSNATGC